QSVGRFPDGGDSLYVMPHPTIAHENMLSSYATRWEPTTTDPDGIDFKQSHMAGISLAYSHDALIIKSEEDMHPVLRIYSTGGQLVLSQQLEMSSPHERITISPLAPGIYVAQLEDNDGNRCSIKFSK
nr:T9SS type A sorting domain-containing protein [Bacteroidaceae bacterium]